MLCSVISIHIADSRSIVGIKFSNIHVYVRIACYRIVFVGQIEYSAFEYLAVCVILRRLVLLVIGIYIAAGGTNCAKKGVTFSGNVGYKALSTLARVGDSSLLCAGSGNACRLVIVGVRDVCSLFFIICAVGIIRRCICAVIPVVRAKKSI